MKNLISLLLTLLSLNLFANQNVTVTIDGDVYSCSKGGSTQNCKCRVKGNFTELFINDVAVWIEHGIGGPQMLNCVKYQGNVKACQ